MASAAIRNDRLMNSFGKLVNGLPGFDGRQSFENVGKAGNVPVDGLGVTGL